MADLILSTKCLLFKGVLGEGDQGGQLSLALVCYACFAANGKSRYAQLRAYRHY